MFRFHFGDVLCVCVLCALYVMYFVFLYFVDGWVYLFGVYIKRSEKRLYISIVADDRGAVEWVQDKEPEQQEQTLTRKI